MNLRPSDLGPALHRELLLKRARAKGDGRPAMGLRKAWTRMAEHPESVTDAAGDVAGRSAAKVVSLSLAAGVLLFAIDPRGVAVLPGASLAVAGTSAVLALGLGILPRRAARRAIEAEVTRKEIEALLRRRVRQRTGRTDSIESFVDAMGSDGAGSAAKDLLADALASLFGAKAPRPAPAQRSPEEAFLELARDVIAGGSPRDPEGVRDTVATLGKALAAIPHLEPPSVEAGDLVVEAQVLLRRSAAESDPVVEASLVRRARALLDRSAAVERAAALAKRTQALRGELLARIDGLRTLLPTLRDSGGMDRADVSLTHSVDQVRTLEREGRSLADARRELAELLDGVRAAEVAPEPVALVQGNGGGGA
ncbi:MAG: hypothetical protein ACKO5K_17225 [Armatimonadota bacterium]